MHSAVRLMGHTWPPSSSSTASCCCLCPAPKPSLKARMADSSASGSYSPSTTTPRSGSMKTTEEHSIQTSKLEFSEDEEDLVTRMYNLIGKRWALIAGRIPGRTAEEIERFWTSRSP